MGWSEIVKGLVGAAHGYLQGSVQRTQIEANNRLSVAFTESSNQVRAASNGFEAAKGSLARYMQSLNNNKRLEAGGHALEASLVNTRRQQDVITAQGFESEIRNAEQTGAQAAKAAFAGVGGDAVDMVSASTRLTQQRAAEFADRAQGYSLYDAARRAGAIVSQTIRGLDNSLIIDSLDYNRNTATIHKSLSPWRMAEMGAADAMMGTGMLQNNGLSEPQRPTYTAQHNTPQQSFRFAEIQQQNSGSEASFFNFGTGSDFGNQDYGSFI